MSATVFCIRIHRGISGIRIPGIQASSFPSFHPRGDGQKYLKTMHCQKIRSATKPDLINFMAINAQVRHGFVIELSKV